MRHTRGNYTEDPMKHASQLIGSLARELDRILGTQVSGLGESDRRHHKQRFSAYKNAVHWYLAEIPQDKLFKEKGTKFTHKQASEGIGSPSRLQKVLERVQPDYGQRRGYI